MEVRAKQRSLQSRWRRRKPRPPGHSADVPTTTGAAWETGEVLLCREKQASPTKRRTDTATPPPTLKSPRPWKERTVSEGLKRTSPGRRSVSHFQPSAARLWLFRQTERGPRPTAEAADRPLENLISAQRLVCRGEIKTRNFTFS